MGVKVYKKGYQVIVDDPTKNEEIFKTCEFTRFGFDGDNVWVKEIVYNTHIFVGDVSEVLDSAGNPIGDKEAVETYFLAFIGATDSDDSPLESTNPTLLSVTIEDAAPKDLVMVFSEPVTGTNLGFTIGGTTSTTFASISGSGTTFTGVLANNSLGSEDVTLGYASATGDFEDIGGNILEDITNKTVINNSVVEEAWDISSTELTEGNGKYTFASASQQNFLKNWNLQSDFVIEFKATATGSSATPIMGKGYGGNDKITLYTSGRVIYKDTAGSSITSNANPMSPANEWWVRVERVSGEVTITNLYTDGVMASGTYGGIYVQQIGSSSGAYISGSVDWVTINKERYQFNEGETGVNALGTMGGEATPTNDPVWSAVAGNGVKLDWTDGGTAESYNIYKEDELLFSVNAGVESMDDFDVSAATTYAYKLIPVIGGVEETRYSNTVSVTTS